MIRVFCLGLSLLLGGCALGRSDFHTVLADFDRAYGVQVKEEPLARWLTGASVAVAETRVNVDSAEVFERVRAQLCPRWVQVVKTKSEKESVAIFALPEKKRWALMIVTVKAEELGIVQIEVEADQLGKWLKRS